jgi:Ni,Fe-hydrogenase III large subunit
LRGVNVIGGVTKDIQNEERNRLLTDLTNIAKDFSEIINIAESSASLQNRLKTTGILSFESALEKGAIGMPARAVGIKCDTRVDFPYSAYSELGFNRVETENDGDAYARFMIRVKEVRASIELIKKALNELPEGSIKTEKIGKFKENAVIISAVEGWRGEIVYFITTDKKGEIQRVFPRDPSFVNWSLLGCAGPKNIVPDFPLINKSFNLSYTGNDL